MSQVIKTAVRSFVHLSDAATKGSTWQFFRNLRHLRQGKDVVDLSITASKKAKLTWFQQMKETLNFFWARNFGKFKTFQVDKVGIRSTTKGSNVRGAVDQATTPLAAGADASKPIQKGRQLMVVSEA
jgi:hypothetical protein